MAIKLSRERIVEAAIDVLDTEGEQALTFRVLTTRLATGPGAVYWHVANKRELMNAATDSVIAEVLTDIADVPPTQAIRDIALGVFDAIDAHPWVGAQLSREPWHTAILEIFEVIGGRLSELDVPPERQFDAASALLHYILGVAGQNAANARLAPAGGDRAAVLASITESWTGRDPATHPFIHHIAGQLRDHDDREQFLAGVDLILAGIAATRRPA